MRTCCNGAEKERGGKRKFCFEKKRETNARLVFSVSGGVEKNSRLGEGGSQESFFAGGLAVKMTFFYPFSPCTTYILLEETHLFGGLGLN